MSEPKISIQGINMARINKQLRTIKMMQPIHPECQFPARKNWWKSCEEAGHDPYINDSLVNVEVPVYETDDDGDEVLVRVDKKKKRVREPNITQVPLDPGINDGRGPERFAATKGFIQLEEKGYKPMCQMFDCWLDAALFTPYGEYCSKEHARIIGAREEGVALEVLQPRKRAKQLRDIELA